VMRRFIDRFGLTSRYALLRATNVVEVTTIEDNCDYRRELVYGVCYFGP